MSRGMQSPVGQSEPGSSLRPEVLRAAAEWHVLLHSGEAEADELQEFAQWQQDPVHARAYAELDRVWRQFDAAVPLPARQTLKAVVGESLSSPRNPSSAKESGLKKSAIKKTAIGLCGVCCVLFSALIWQASQRPESAGALKNYLSSSYLGADYRTGIGERRIITLSDQSTLILNTFSAVNVRYTDQQREIQLLQGEIKLQVAKDPLRPMTVSTRHGSATALGTRYSVYDQGEVTRVQVIESLVQVCASDDFSDPKCERIATGQVTSMSDSQVASPRPMDKDFEHDWLANQLVVSNQPLARVLGELSRYQRGLVKMDREALRDLRVSGVFPLGDPERALAVLEQSLPIAITRYSPLLTVINPR